MGVERGERSGVGEVTKRKSFSLGRREAELITKHVKPPQPMKGGGFVMTWMMSPAGPNEDGSERDVCTRMRSF